jgi:hypothetical protein
MKSNLAVMEEPTFDDGDGGWVTFRMRAEHVAVMLNLCRDELRRQGIEPAPEESPRRAAGPAALRLVRGGAVILAMLLSVVVGVGPAAAQTPKARGACATVTIAGGGAFGGMDLQASPSGAGIFITSLVVDAATGAYAARTSSAAVLTASLATITPLATFGQGALTTVVREGTAPGTLGEGAMLLVGDTTVFDSLPAIFVPPGSFFTIQRTTTGTTSNATVCFTEA